MGITETLCNYNTAIIQQCSYIGIFILMTLESMIAPVPSELVMPFAGFLIYTGHFDPLWVMVASSLGSIVGSLLSYGMGMLGKPVVLRYGRYLLLNPHHLEWTKNFFARHGSITIFISRFIPVVRHLISIPAGLARMSLAPFILYTVVGATMWNGFLTYCRPAPQGKLAPHPGVHPYPGLPGGGLPGGGDGIFCVEIPGGPAVRMRQETILAEEHPGAGRSPANERSPQGLRLGVSFACRS
jgi:membrane protein DedA with SNARE-associated domain